MSHGSDKDSPLYKDMQMQEFKDFNIAVIETFDTKMKALWAEKKHILEQKSFSPEIGYNIMLGSSHAIVTKEKIKKTVLKNGISDEQRMHIQLMGFSRKGTKASKTTLKKLSESHIGQVAWNKGKKLSESHKKALSFAKQGKLLSPETKLKMSQVAKERWEKIKNG
jgi:hypothetical protein